MLGVVGYTCNKDFHGYNLKNMLQGNNEKFRTDIFYGNHLHVACTNLFPDSVKMPVWSEDGTFGIMFSGRIYGYEDYVEILKGLGHKFAGNSCSEFIVHLFEEYGNDAFGKLNGSYSFVIFDNRGKVLIVCDRFGTRPVFYALHNGNLIFASSCRSILKYPYPRILNEKTIVKFFRYGKLGILGNDTWFRGISVVPSASYLEFSGDQIKIQRYWDLHYTQDRSVNEEVLLEELVRTFKKAVNVRIDDKMKNAVSLSGGLDSRAVHVAIDGKSREKVYPYTYGVKGSDEIKIARAVAGITGNKHMTIEFNENELADCATENVSLTDGFSVGLGLAPCVLKKLTGIGIQVVSSGFAFDLILGGSFLKKRVMQSRTVNELIAYLDSRYTLFSPAEMTELLSPRLRHFSNDVKHEFEQTVRNSKGDSVQSMADYFALDTRVRRLILNGDMIIREFVEETHPTIDNEVIDIVTKIPAEWRYRHRIYKKFLKKLDSRMARVVYVDHLVPASSPDFLWKVGTFYLVLCRLIRHALFKLTKGRICLHDNNLAIDYDMVYRVNPRFRNLISETLLNGNSLCYKLDYLNKDFVKKVVNEHYNGIKDGADKIAFLVTFELLLRIFLRPTSQN